MTLETYINRTLHLQFVTLSSPEQQTSLVSIMLVWEQLYFIMTGSVRFNTFVYHRFIYLHCKCLNHVCRPTDPRGPTYNFLTEPFAFTCNRKTDQARQIRVFAKARRVSTGPWNHTLQPDPFLCLCLSSQKKTQTLTKTTHKALFLTNIIYITRYKYSAHMSVDYLCANK